MPVRGPLKELKNLRNVKIMTILPENIEVRHVTAATYE
jgi:hypothetical protein